MNTLNAPLTLHGKTVTLVSLDKQHFPHLQTLARTREIWEFNPSNLVDAKTFEASLHNALMEREKATQFPFTIFLNDKIIGSTRLMDIQPVHNKLEIGATWLHPDYWGTVVNLECKLLLLTHSFETLGVQRVHIKTDENNIRSRKAIEKIGGRFEGIIRNDMVRSGNNTKRNSASYSIIDDEWHVIKVMLEKLCNEKISVI